MEIDTEPNQRLNCSISLVPKLNRSPQEEYGSETILWCEDEKAEELYLKQDEKESSSDDKFIESAYMGRIENKKKLDENESDLCLEESSCIKWDTKTFKMMSGESNDRSIDKELDNNIMEPYVIKKETNDANEVAADQLLNYINESPFQSEFIEQKEIHIKEEEDVKDSPNERVISRPMKQTVLHQCPECPYSTNLKGNLKSHSLKHNKGDEIDWYSCQECLYKTCRKSNLKSHAEIHKNLILKCLKCSYQTLRPTSFKEHQMQHKTNIQWLHCPYCSFKTRWKSYLRNHSLTHKSSNSFKCTNCPYQAKRKAQLAIHQVKHESMDKWHSCPLCPFKSHAKNLFVSHCRRRHSVDPNNHKHVGNFKCTECFFESVCRSSMKKHRLMHDQSSWLHCPDCVYKSPYKNDMRKHQVRHKGEHAEGWYRCAECFYKTPHKYDLRKHVILHRSADEIRLFKCSQCSFKTAHKNSLRRHQLKHKNDHEIEWFRCYQCRFKTKYKLHLAPHISKHKKPKQIDQDCVQNSG